MPIEWEDSRYWMEGEGLTALDRLFPGSDAVRLDGLLPSDPLTQAVTETALHIYIQSIMELVMRSNQSLSLIALAVDDNSMLQSFRPEDMGLVARAIIRCMQQETRSYDVIGRTDATDSHGLPTFLLVCPLMSESRAFALAERLRSMMTSYALEADQEWLAMSVGVTGLAIDVQTAEELTARALSALRVAKHQGSSILRHSDMIRRIQESSENYGDGEP
jgi:diguanylate cyclase (GGDEF)-like protein